MQTKMTHWHCWLRYLLSETYFLIILCRSDQLYLLSLLSIQQYCFISWFHPAFQHIFVCQWWYLETALWSFSEMWRGASCRVSLLCCWSSDNITGGPAAHTHQSLWSERVRVITLARPLSRHKSYLRLSQWQLQSVCQHFLFVFQNQEAKLWDQLPFSRSERCWNVSVSGLWLGFGCCIRQCGQAISAAEDGH